MEAIGTLLQTAAIVIAGLAVRFAVALALLAVAVGLLLPVLYTGEGVRRLWLRLEGFEPLAGLWWRRRTYYAPSHAWLRLRTGLLRIGLDDLAGRLLRKVTAVTLPTVGASVKEGAPLVTLGSGRREVVIPSPIDGTVARVNPGLAAKPDRIVTSPYVRGWLVDVRPSNDRFRTFRHDDEAAGWMMGEAARLSHALELATGIAAADGGDPIIPAHLAVSDQELDTLTREFLRFDGPGLAAAAQRRGHDVPGKGRQD